MNALYTLGLWTAIYYSKYNLLSTLAQHPVRIFQTTSTMWGKNLHKNFNSASCSSICPTISFRLLDHRLNVRTSQFQKFVLLDLYKIRLFLFIKLKMQKNSNLIQVLKTNIRLGIKSLKFKPCNSLHSEVIYNRMSLTLQFKFRAQEQKRLIANFGHLPLDFRANYIKKFSSRGCSV